jgi:amino-acid N-acetyltransferase
VSTNAVVVRPAGVLDGVDSQNTGKVISVDVVMLSSLLNQRLVPILPPLGYDHQGVAFRVNSDSLAIAVAVALHAKKVIFASVLAGVEFGEELVRQMTVSQAEQLLRDESDRIATPMISKLKHAAAGCRDGISRIHLINGTAEEGLLAEVFSNEGIGTLVYSDDYQVIRSATLDDVSFIHSLVKDAASDDEVIARTQIEIEARIDDHYVLEIDDNPVACVAMHSHPECGKAELASLVVSEGHRKFGLASRLIEHIEEEARKQQVRHLFCLSTQAFSYFKRKAGFEDGKPDDLPTERRQRWASNGRNSKILTKLLT